MEEEQIFILPPERGRHRLENSYQGRLIKVLESRFPGCFITKLDSGYLQGIPDLLILWHDRWGVLEVKKSRRERTEPNQLYYVELLNRMSFAAFIYPENEGEVLDALEQALCG